MLNIQKWLGKYISKLPSSENRVKGNKTTSQDSTDKITIHLHVFSMLTKNWILGNMNNNLTITEDIYRMKIMDPSSPSKLTSQVTSTTNNCKALYSASVVDNAIMVGCFLDFQETQQSLKKIRYNQIQIS